MAVSYERGTPVGVARGFDAGASKVRVQPESEVRVQPESVGRVQLGVQSGVLVPNLKLPFPTRSCRCLGSSSNFKLPPLLRLTDTHLFDTWLEF